jgi:hypothetical protein
MRQNIICDEFGLRTLEEVEAFLATTFTTMIVLVADRMDESLVVLRKLFNWSLLDITYMRVLGLSDLTK